MIKYLKNNNITAFEFFLVFVSIVFNLNTLVVATNLSSSAYAFIFLALYSIVLFYKILKGGIEKHDSKKAISLMFIFLMLIFVTAIINLDFHILYFVLLMEVFKAIILCLLIDYRKIFKLYILIIFLLSLYSLLIYFASIVFPTVASIGKPVYSNSGHLFYSYIFYFRETSNISRNFGFLSEPGDFQHYINIALAFTLFSENKLSRKAKFIISLILTITSITTFSPVGLVFSVLIWIAFLLQNIKRIEIVVPAIIFALFFATILYRIPAVQNGILHAINKATSIDSGSFAVRLLGFTSGLDVFLSNPFFGRGYSNGTALMESIFIQRGFYYNQTSTLTGYLAFFGFFLSFIVFYLFFHYFREVLKINTIPFFVFFVGLFISINDERLIWELTFYIFVVSGFFCTNKRFGKKAIKKNIFCYYNSI